MIFRQLFDAESSTYTYLLADAGQAVIVDPVLEQVDRDVTLIRELELVLVHALDTHVHADHVTALGTLRERLGCKTVLSERAGSGAADTLVKEGDRIRFGSRQIEVLETPGHTSGCLTYVLDDRSLAMTGDALLVRGCGRTDFQDGDAHLLYRSVHQKLFTLPDATLLYPGHDYRGRTVTSVAEEKKWNPRLGGGKSEADFVDIMAKLQLAKPAKIDVAVPANLQCGVPRGLPVSAEPHHRVPLRGTPPAGEPASAQGWAPIETSAGGIPEIAPEWVAAHAGAARMVDVREKDEWVGELGHVPGAELVPLATVDAAARGWDRDAPIVTICRSGGRSGKAALQLRALGFQRVASMRGGMTAWNARRLPTAGGVPRSGTR